ncbi:MAG: hypothetical protein C4582_09370 [Desulfobacteraceae bacterium]|nr:MAG: hypothetical protein C4582_09370 [Desulfobacteraceae bacterium]
MRFVVDSMLGKLARWLRVMGHDAQYRTFYETGELGVLASKGLIVLSRDKKLLAEGIPFILIHSDKVGEQLLEVNREVDLRGFRELRFSRCLECNVCLEDADPEDSEEALPEYINLTMKGKVRRCPACRRLFWPGSHRKNMEEQLKVWGF